MENSTRFETKIGTYITPSRALRLELKMRSLKLLVLPIKLYSLNNIIIKQNLYSLCV